MKRKKSGFTKNEAKLPTISIEEYMKSMGVRDELEFGAMSLDDLYLAHNVERRAAPRHNAFNFDDLSYDELEARSHSQPELPMIPKGLYSDCPLDALAKQISYPKGGMVVCSAAHQPIHDVSSQAYMNLQVRHLTRLTVWEIEAQAVTSPLIVNVNPDMLAAIREITEHEPDYKIQFALEISKGIMVRDLRSRYEKLRARGVKHEVARKEIVRKYKVSKKKVAREIDYIGQAYEAKTLKD